MKSFELKDLRIPLSAIPPEGLVIRETIRFESLSEAARIFPRPVRIECKITHLKGEYWVELTAEGEGEFECDRCCTHFQRRITGKVGTLYTPDVSAERDVDVSDIRFLKPGSTEMDLSGDLIDALILSLPIKRLCKTDCAGICPRCGADLNEHPCRCGQSEPDPRWDSLRNMKQDSKEKE